MVGRHEVTAVVRDPVMHGLIPMTSLEFKAYSTPPMVRLGGIPVASNFPGSLDILPRNTSKPTQGSRRLHSAGTLYGSTIATELPAGKKSFNELGALINMANLLHDIGSFPFSHAAEEAGEKTTGKTHEERAIDFIDGSPNLRKLLVDAFGEESIEIIGEAIRGETKIRGEHYPWVLMVNAGHGGIDIDNIDNVQRSLFTRRITTFRHYDPNRLFQAFNIIEGELVLSLRGLHDLNGWVEARKLLFTHINDPENMAPQSFGERGLEMARQAGNLNTEFFDLTDSEATKVLLDPKRVEPDVRTIFDRIAKSRSARSPYKRIYNLVTEKPTDAQRLYFSNPDNKYSLADRICELLHLPRTDVAVQMGKSKGYRDISILILLEGDLIQFQQPHGRKRWTLQVFMYNDRHNKYDEEELRKVIDQDLNGSDKAAVAA